MKSNISLNIKSNYVLSKWQLKKAAFQKLKDLLSFGKQRKLLVIFYWTNILKSMLKRKDFLQAKKHNASVSALAGEENISHPGRRIPKVLIRYSTLVVFYNDQSTNVFILIEHCDLASFNVFVYYWAEKLLIENLLDQLQWNIQMKTVKIFEKFKNTGRDCLEGSNKSWKAFFWKNHNKGHFI